MILFGLLITVFLSMIFFFHFSVFFQALTYLSTKNRDNAPHTPRVILLGPTGSGKREQASLLCSKYQLVHGKIMNFM